MTTIKRINIDNKYWFNEIILEPGDTQEILTNAQCSGDSNYPPTRPCIHGSSNGYITYSYNGQTHTGHEDDVVDSQNFVRPPEEIDSITLSSTQGGTFYWLCYIYNILQKRDSENPIYRLPDIVEKIETDNLQQYTIPEDGCIAHTEVTTNFSIDPKAYSVLKDEIIDVSETNSLVFISDNYT